ncbi:Clustered mitochondria protein -like protein, partial [Caligus rogercresseyi]
KDKSSMDNKEIEEKEKMEDEEAKKIVESITDSITSGDKKDIEESTRDIVKKASLAVGSLKETEFDIRFNPDDEDGDFYKKQCTLVKDASEFLLTVQIPSFIRDCLDHSGAPMEGMSLCDNLHNRGVNLRYLGVIANMLAKVPQLEYIYSIAASEVITRCAKHLFTSFMQNIELTYLSAAISHFLNCFLSNSSNLSVLLCSFPEERRHKKNKKGGKANNNSKNDSSAQEWASLSPKTLWADLCREASSYYNFSLPSALESQGIDAILDAYSLQKISLLRSFCLKTGIQIMHKEYSLEANSSSQIFSEEDILNIFPIVKHINPRATDAYNFYTTGQSKIQQGYLKDGYELISEA